MGRHSLIRPCGGSGISGGVPGGFVKGSFPGVISGSFFGHVIGSGSSEGIISGSWPGRGISFGFFGLAFRDVHITKSRFEFTDIPVLDVSKSIFFVSMSILVIDTVQY